MVEGTGPLLKFECSRIKGTIIIIIQARALAFGASPGRSAVARPMTLQRLVRKAPKVSMQSGL